LQRQGSCSETLASKGGECSQKGYENRICQGVDYRATFGSSDRIAKRSGL
jgi:hypothetical protein